MLLICVDSAAVLVLAQRASAGQREMGLTRDREVPSPGITDHDLQGTWEVPQRGVRVRVQVESDGNVGTVRPVARQPPVGRLAEVGARTGAAAAKRACAAEPCDIKTATAVEQAPAIATFSGTAYAGPCPLEKARKYAVELAAQRPVIDGLARRSTVACQGHSTDEIEATGSTAATTLPDAAASRAVKTTVFARRAADVDLHLSAVHQTPVTAAALTTAPPPVVVVPSPVQGTTGAPSATGTLIPGTVVAVPVPGTVVAAPVAGTTPAALTVPPKPSTLDRDSQSSSSSGSDGASKKQAGFPWLWFIVFVVLLVPCLVAVRVAWRQVMWRARPAPSGDKQGSPRSPRGTISARERQRLTKAPTRSMGGADQDASPALAQPAASKPPQSKAKPPSGPAGAAQTGAVPSDDDGFEA